MEEVSSATQYFCIAAIKLGYKDHQPSAQVVIEYIGSNTFDKYKKYFVSLVEMQIVKLEEGTGFTTESIDQLCTELDFANMGLIGLTSAAFDNAKALYDAALQKARRLYGRFPDN